MVVFTTRHRGFLDLMILLSTTHALVDSAIRRIVIALILMIAGILFNAKRIGLMRSALTE
jgi:hypothetical protein